MSAKPKIRSREAVIKTFTTKIRVYWSDCDPAGIMYYANFFRYFEIAEEELYVSLGISRPELFARHKIGFPRVETWARFRKPAAQGDVVAVTLWVEKRTEKSMLHCFEVRIDGQTDLVAEGSYWIVCVHRPEFHSVPLPQEIVELMKDYLPPVSRRSREQGDRHPHRDIAP
jgi:YbgC/YbaW family acyl-CoA thioester hydrolase